MATSNPSATGQCANCGANNPYTSSFCGSCGQRLPWADALEAANRQRQTPLVQPPPAPAPTRPTVPPQPFPVGPQKTGLAPQDKRALQVLGCIVAPLAFLLFVAFIGLVAKKGVVAAAPEIFALLLMSALVCLAIGLVSPKVFSRFFKVQPTRKKIFHVFGGATVAIFLLFAVIAPPAKRKLAASPTSKATAKPKSTTPPAVVRRQQAQVKARAQAEQRRQEAQEQQRQAASEGVSNKIKKYLDENFGMPGYETTWHSSIQSVSVEGSTVTVQTNMVKNEIFNDTVSGVCGGVSGFVFANPNQSLGLDTIEIYDTNGQLMLRRSGIGDSCSV